MKRIYTLIAVTAVAVLTASAEATDINTVSDALYFDQTEVKAGDNTTLQIKLKNTTSSVGTFGAKVTLPEGITFEAAGEDPDVSLLNDRTGSNTFTVASAFQNSDSEVRIGFLQNDGQNLADNDGAVVALTVKVADSVAEGSYDVTFSEQEFVEAATSANYFPAEAKSVIVVTAADGINSVWADGTKAQQPAKKLVNGRLVIETQDGTYSASGSKIK